MVCPLNPISGVVMVTGGANAAVPLCARLPGPVRPAKSRCTTWSPGLLTAGTY